MQTPYVTPEDPVPFEEGWISTANLTPNFSMDSIAVQSLFRITELARQGVEKLGESYRAFKVGAAVLAIDSRAERLGVYLGGNYMPYKGAEWNCAEKRAFEKTIKEGFTKILALAVCGPPQPDENSGVTSPTLHPCKKCRGMLRTSPLVDDRTLITTANLDGSEHELFTRKSLLDLHDNGIAPEFPKEYGDTLDMVWYQLLQEENPADSPKAIEFLKARGLLV